MKIVNAEWEKRNLGVETLEINIDETDLLETVERILQEMSAEYVVVKLPSTRADLLEVVSNSGYRYVEDMVVLVSDLHEVNFSPLNQRFYDSVSVEEMNESDMEELEREIRNGLFATDRVSLDSYFSKEQAYNRYINWVRDEYKKGTYFYKYIYNDKVIGFFALSEKELGKYTSFLGGIYKEYRKGGIGTVVKVPEVVRKLGGKRLSVSVSTNNIGQIRNLICNGYVPEEIIHTFIKHAE